MPTTNTIHRHTWFKTKFGQKFVVTGIVYGRQYPDVESYEVLYLYSTSPVTIDKSDFLSRVDRRVFIQI